MDLRIVKWQWRRFPCVVCRSMLSRYWVTGRTCSWRCEKIYAQRQGWI